MFWSNITKIPGKSNHLFFVLAIFISCNYIAHDLGIDKVFYCMLVGYPFLILEKFSSKIEVSIFKKLYLSIFGVICAFATFWVSEYSSADIIAFLKSLSIPVFMVIFGIYVFFSKTNDTDIIRFCKLILLFGIFVASFLIIFKIFPNVYLHNVLPYLIGVDKAEAKDNIAMGYGVPLGGGYTFADIIIALCMIICFAFEKRSLSFKSKLYLRLLEIYYFVGCICVGRRSEILCVFSSLFILYIAGKNLKRLRTYLEIFKRFSVVFISISALMCSLFLLGFTKRFDNTVSRYNQQASLNTITSGRMFLWATAISKFIESPIFGNGWRFFPDYYKRNINRSKILNVHNTFIQFLCETGIVGSIIMFIPIFYLYIAIFKLYRKYELNYVDDNNFLIHLSLTIALGLQTFYWGLAFMDNHFYKGLYYCMLAICVLLADYANKKMKTLKKYKKE